MVVCCVDLWQSKIRSRKKKKKIKEEVEEQQQEEKQEEEAETHGSRNTWIDNLTILFYQGIEFDCAILLACSCK